MASKKVLVTRPEYDVETMYLSSWNKEIVKLANAKGLIVLELARESANRKEFEKYVLKQNPRLVLLNGHGGSDTVYGHKDEPLVVCNDNEAVLKNKIIYALSCSSADELGQSAVDKGAEAYIGYTLPFGWLTNKNKECRPENDELANVFKEASNQVPATLVKGQTTQEAYDRSQSKFKELMRQFSSSDALPEAKEMRYWLFWDMHCQKLIGNADARMN